MNRSTQGGRKERTGAGKKALHKSGKNFRAVTDNSRDVIWMVDTDLRFTYISPAIEQLTGYTVEEYLSKPHEEIFPPPYFGMIMQALAEELEIEKMPGKDPLRTRTIEVQAARKDGSRKWVELRASGMRNAPGKLTGFLGFSRDITEQKKAEEQRLLMEKALRESEEKYRRQIEKAPVGFYRINLSQGKFIQINDVMSHYTGYTHEELMQMSPADLLTQESLELFLERLRKKENNEPVPPTVEYLIRVKNGGVKWAELESRDYVDGNERFADVVIRDITERKRAEEHRLQMEKALRESEERYRNILDSIEDAYFELDLTGNITFFNNAALTITGYAPEELKLMNYRRYSSPEVKKRMYQVFNSIYLTGNPEKIVDFEVIRKDGQPIVLQMNVSLMKDQNGAPAGFRCLARDVTELKHAEDALRKSEQKFREFSELMPQTLFEIDAGGRLLFVNNAAYELFGYGREDFSAGLTVFDVLASEEHERAVKNIAVTAARGVGTGNEYVMKKKDGSHLTGLLFSSAIYGENGRIQGFRGIIIDVTDRKMMEKDLRRSEEKYRLITENSTDVIWTMSLDGRFLYVSPSVTMHAGYTPEEAMAMTIETYMCEEDLPWVMQVLHEEMQKPREQRAERKIMEFRQYKKDGSLLDVEVSVSWLYDDSGEIIGLQGSTRNISERKKMERERARLEAQLIQAQKMEALGMLAGGIAHDFNNLLAGIQGYNALMQMGLGPDHPYQARLKKIDEQIKRGSNLTRQFLGLARGGKYDVRPLNLNLLLTETSDIFGQTKKEVAISKLLERDIWMVEADRGQIEQVLMNLYINAWQAMPGGGEITLETANVTLDEQDVAPHGLRAGRYVKIAVTDKGMGMDEQTQERIFEPFFTTKEQGKGSGLGLASAYGIVKNHDGFISVVSEPGVGSTFRIYLPASDKGMEMEKQPGGKKPIPQGRETILLVDDEMSIIITTRELLEMMGYTVLAAAGGHEAVKVFMEKMETIDLVILDMIMPGMGGGKTFDELRAIDPGVKVLLSSGYSSDGEAQQILSRGCRGFIQKPYQIDELSRKLREILESV